MMHPFLIRPHPPTPAAATEPYLFGATSPWNLAANGSVDPLSTTLIDSPSSTGSLQYSFNAVSRGFDIASPADAAYGVPIYMAYASDPRIHMGDNTGWWGGLTGVPMPAGASASPGSDHHLAVWDVPGKKVYEFWNTQHIGASWSAGLGAVFESTGLGYQTTVSAGSARAYGGSLIGGIIMRQEMAAGSIPHALAWAYPYTRGKFYAMGLGADGVNQNIACHCDNTSLPNRNSSGNIPEGARIRLKPSVVVTNICNGNVACEVIGKALQTYGGYLVDTAGSNTFYCENRPPSDWSGLLAATDARNFQAAHFELLSLPSTLVQAN